MNRSTLVLAGILILLGGCSDSPTAPVEDGINPSWPALPAPDWGAIDIYPQETEPRVISNGQFLGDFEPRVVDLNARWNFSFSLPALPDQTVFEGISWASQLPEVEDPTLYHDGRYRLDSLGHDAVRARMLAGGTPIYPQLVQEFGVDLVGSFPNRRYRWTGLMQRIDIADAAPVPVRVEIPLLPSASSPALASNGPAFIQRERLWVLSSLSDSSSVKFEILGPGSSLAVERNYSLGFSETESYEFGRSLTISAGGGAGGFSASVEATLSETFGTSVTLDSSSGGSITRTLTAPEGESRLISFWTLIDRYRLVDADGEEYQGTNLVIDPVVMDIPIAARLENVKYEGP